MNTTQHLGDYMRRGGRERGREGGRIERQGGEEREDSSGKHVSH